MKTINRDTVIKLLLEKSNLELDEPIKKEVLVIIFTNFIELLREELKKGSIVSLTNFGKFILKEYNRTTFLNPRTHKELTKKTRFKICFKEFGSLKSFLNRKRR